MANTKKEPLKKTASAKTPEARESQLINLAFDEAERQIREGNASSGVLVHFLKLGTEKAKLERAKLANETELLKAKTESLESTKKIEELYSEAMIAMKSYSGMQEDIDDEIL